MIITRAEAASIHAVSPLLIIASAAVSPPDDAPANQVAA